MAAATFLPAYRPQQPAQDTVSASPVRPYRSPLGVFPLARATYPTPTSFKAPVAVPSGAAELRQDWAGNDWLRGHLSKAKLRIAVNAEPATVARMKSKLRSIGVLSPEIQESVGMTLAGYLKGNPRLPLWAALAMVLEATGRFTPNVVGGAA